MLESLIIFDKMSEAIYYEKELKKWEKLRDLAMCKDKNIRKKSK